MKIRILETPGVPRGLEQVYATEAARVAEARFKAEADRREAETQRGKQLEEEREAIKVRIAKQKEQDTMGKWYNSPHLDTKDL